MEPRTLIIDAVAIGPVGHAHGGDLPRRLARAAIAPDDGTGGVGGAIEPHDPVGIAGAAHRRQPAAAIEHDQHVIDHAVLQRIGQLDRIAIGHVALRVRDGNVARRHDAPGLAVPHHLVGAKPVSGTYHPHVARRGDDIRIVIIFQRAGAELHLIGVGRRGSRRGRGGRTILQLLRPRCRGRCQHQQRCGAGEMLKTHHVDCRAPVGGLIAPIASLARTCNARYLLRADNRSL